MRLNTARNFRSIKSTSRRTGISVVLGLSTCLAGSGLQSAQEQSDTIRATTFSSGDMLQMLLALVTVVFIIFALSVALKKFTNFSGASSDLIKILSSVALSNKDRLLLIQVGGEQIVISSSPGRITKIHSLHTPIDLGSATADEQAPDNRFASLLELVKHRSRP